MTVDNWCFVQLPGGKRTRGRLVQRSETELMLLTAGPTVQSFTIQAIDVRAKAATLDDGSILRWQSSCACGWPKSLKGPVDDILAKVVHA